MAPPKAAVIFLGLILMSKNVFGSRVPNHRKVRQIKESDVVTVSEERFRNMDASMKHNINLNYAREFFKPINPSLPMKVKFLLSPTSFLRESPQSGKLFETLPGISTFDFDGHMRQKKDVFFSLYLHEMEENRKKGKNLGEGEDFLKVNLPKMLVMLNNVFTLPRNYRAIGPYRNAASDYISQKFGNLGLLVGLQYFLPSRFYYQFVGYNPDIPDSLNTLPQGANVFGVYPGQLWGTPMDRIVVIGAHWDTIGNTDGYNDNGSGVAAVLELARQIVQSHCQPRHTIIFATFDLEEMGAQGSFEFVSRFLVPKILRKFGQKDIGGVFIADTIMNLNRTEGSQVMSEEWDNIDPVTSKKIHDNGDRGDFVALVQRRQPDQKLVALFRKYWFHGQSASKDPFKLRSFRIDLDKRPANLEKLVDYVPFVRSDHSRFWMVNQTDYLSLPAILITDTGPQRGKMMECYHKACDSVRGPYNANFADMTFYQHIVQTLLNSVIELSKSVCLRTEDLSGFYSLNEVATSEEESEASSATSNKNIYTESLLTLTQFLRRFMPW